jgi:hypothetical protein
MTIPVEVELVETAKDEFVKIMNNGKIFALGLTPRSAMDLVDTLLTEVEDYAKMMENAR